MPADILHILGSSNRDGSSIARIVAQIAANVDANRYAIHACFLGGNGPAAEQLRSAGLDVWTCEWMKGARDPAGALRFWRESPRRDWRIVHVHYGARSVQRLARWITGARIIYHVHMPDRVSPESFDLRPIPAPDADAVIAVSQAVAQLVQGRPTRVIYNGVDVPAADAAPKSSTPKMILGAASRLASEKGLIYLLRAMPAILAAHPQASLEIAGEGPAEAALREECGRLGVTDAVHFLGWCEDLAPLHARWSVFVSSSVNEGLGVSVLEAMAAGLPVVATNAGGLPEVVEHDRTGWICPMGDPVTLATRVIELLSSEELRAKMGAAGRERVRERFTVRRMAAAVASVYDDLLTVR